MAHDGSNGHKHLDKLYEIAVNRSFFYPSNEIYGSVAGFYDYGPIGVRIRRKIVDLWRATFITNGVHELETSIILPEIVLKASGHVGGFTDPIVKCSKCGSKFRADHLVEKVVPKFVWDGNLDTIDHEIKSNKITCPNCGGELSNSKTFNLMFKTGIGADDTPAYNRPETAQGIFTSFLRMFRGFGMRLPLVLVQVGKSFRNEISPRQGLVRMREFTQMELEYFYDPTSPTHNEYASVKESIVPMKYKGVLKNRPISDIVDVFGGNQIMAVYIAKQWAFFTSLGLKKDGMWFRILEDGERPHYSSMNIDLEVETSYGVIEIDGNALRTDYDLNRHAKFSKKSMEVSVQDETGKSRRVVPHVFELSIGLDRLFYAIMDHTLILKTSEKNWDWFNLPPIISPYLTGVFSLVKKDGLREKTEEIFSDIVKDIPSYVNHRGSIGKRYARADEIGVPYCITVDYQTLEDGTVTIRMRNDGWQTRVKVSELHNLIKTLTSKSVVDKDSFESVMF